MQRTDTRSRFRISHARIALIVTVLAAMGIAASSASAYIYVGGPIASWEPQPSTIERLTLDGSAVQPDFIAGPRVESARQIVVDGDRIYWADSSAGDCRLDSASLDGTGVRTLARVLFPTSVWTPQYVAAKCGSALSIAVAGNYLYLGASDFGGSIGRVSIQPPYDFRPDFINLPQLPGEAIRPDAHGRTESLV